MPKTKPLQVKSVDAMHRQQSSQAHGLLKTTQVEGTSKH
jgi:hypothetical protein